MLTLTAALLSGCATPPTATLAPLPPASPEGVATPPPVEECSAVERNDEVYDCREFDPCDSAETALDIRLACCNCNDYYCGPPPWYECTAEPPEFPPDSGPVLTFDRALKGRIPVDGSGALEVHVVPTSDGVFLSVEGIALYSMSTLCTRTQNTLVCDPGRMDNLFSSTELNLIDLRLEDDDGDGVADGGRLRTYGAYHRLGVFGSAPVILESFPISGIRSLQPDLERPQIDTVLDPLPTHPFEFFLHEALQGDDLGPILVDGVEVPVEATVTGPDTFVLAARALPMPPAWGQEVSITGWRDYADHLMSPLSAQFPEDPGDWRDNHGFEIASGGWAARGFTFGPVSDNLLIPLEPSEGFGVAEARAEWNVLVTSMEVPQGATLLFDHRWVRGDDSFAAELTVVDDTGQATLVWSYDPAELEPCDVLQCTQWKTAEVDLSPYADTEVFLRFEAGTRNYPGWPGTVPPILHFALDNVRVE